MDRPIQRSCDAAEPSANEKLADGTTHSLGTRTSTAVPNHPYWIPDQDSLSLLESRGGPFERAGFRRVVVASTPGSRDVSFGAVDANGVRAAIALIGRGRAADSVPPSGYGGIQATRSLSPSEVHAFLHTARKAARATSLTARGLQLDASTVGAREFAIASVVDVQHGRNYSRLARRSLRRAEQAGATVRQSQDPAPFFKLYRPASAGWAVRYPDALISELAAAEVAVFHHVEIEGEVASSLLTLVDGAHWMCWLAAQSDRGRSVCASYLAYDAVFEVASSSVEVVNLGASAPRSGGLQFKGYLGAREVPMISWHAAMTGWSTAHAISGWTRRAGSGAIRRTTRFS